MKLRRKIKVDSSIIRYLIVKYKKLDTKMNFLKKIKNEEKNKKFQKKVLTHYRN